MPLVDKWESNKSSVTLDLGCGNSLLSEKLFDHGYTNIHANDISKTVIEQMQNRSNRSIEYKVMDITNMTEYEDNMFDLIIDKGSFDGLMCDEKNGTFLGAKMLKEV